MKQVQIGSIENLPDRIETWTNTSKISHSCIHVPTFLHERQKSNSFVRSPFAKYTLRISTIWHNISKILHRNKKKMFSKTTTVLRRTGKKRKIKIAKVTFPAARGENIARFCNLCLVVSSKYQFLSNKKTRVRYVAGE